jgi:hypothetical protein
VISPMSVGPNTGLFLPKTVNNFLFMNRTFRTAQGSWVFSFSVGNRDGLISRILSSRVWKRARECGTVFASIHSSAFFLGLIRRIFSSRISGLVWGLNAVDCFGFSIPSSIITPGTTAVGSRG